MPRELPHSEEREERDDPALHLPALGDEDDEDGVGDGDVEIDEPAEGGDPFDDAPAEHVPLDALITTAAEEPTALGDDAAGLEGVAVAEGIQLDEGGPSLIGADAEGLDGDDEDLGVDGASESDDGGAEGVVDPADEKVDELPPMDGASDEHDDGDEHEHDLRIPSREQSGLD
jgi:hypothetical protein